MAAVSGNRHLVPTVRLADLLLLLVAGFVDPLPPVALVDAANAALGQAEGGTTRLGGAAGRGCVPSLSRLAAILYDR